MRLSVCSHPHQRMLLHWRSAVCLWEASTHVSMSWPTPLRYQPRKKQMLELTTHPTQMDTHTSPADIKAALEAAQSGKNVTSCIAGWWCSTWSVGNICSSSKWESKKYIEKGALCFGCARQGREEPFLRAAQAMLVPGLVGKIPQSCQTKCLGSGPSEDRWYSDATSLTCGPSHLEHMTIWPGCCSVRVRT